MCTCTCMWVYNINERIQKMDLNRWGRQTQELISLSKVNTSRGENRRHSILQKQQLGGGAGSVDAGERGVSVALLN